MSLFPNTQSGNNQSINNGNGLVLSSVEVDGNINAPTYSDICLHTLNLASAVSCEDAVTRKVVAGILIELNQIATGQKQHDGRNISSNHVLEELCSTFNEFKCKFTPTNMKQNLSIS